MSRKDYIKIAVAINEVGDNDSSSWSPDYWVSLRLVALRLCEYFQENNPRFDRERFLAACGV